MSLLTCPVCHQELLLSEKIYACPKKHSFDISNEGYVNLLIGNKKSLGDDKMMMLARRDFLTGGWYDPLIVSVAETIEEYFEKKALTVLDLGCGEGWYMRRLQELRKNDTDNRIGLDIAKYGVKIASKKTKGVFVVGNAYDLPLIDASCDVIVSIFSPFDENELKRCLKPGGIAVIVGPGPEHLYRFIELIWDSPHQHKIKSAEEKYTLLTIQDLKKVQISLSLTSSALQNLFIMTPYYRQASKIKQDAILHMESLDLVADFRIEVLSKPTLP